MTNEESLHEEAKGIIEYAIELAKKAKDETFTKNSEKCKEIIKLIDKYRDLILSNKIQWSEENYCLFLKLTDVSDILYDVLFLLISAKYNTARILLRKWLELIIVSIYYDTIGKNELNKKNESYRQLWLDGLNMGSLGFTNKVNKLLETKLIDTSDADDIKKLHKTLSLYVHNVGQKDSFLLPFYDDNEFNQVYSIINQLQSMIEKITSKTYNGTVIF